MSLVNDMLRDLDKQAVSPGSAKRLSNEDIDCEPSRETSFQIANFLPGVVAFIIVGTAIFFSLEPEDAGEGFASAPQTEPSNEPERLSPSYEESTQVLKLLLNAAKTDYYQDAAEVLSQAAQAPVKAELEREPNEAPAMSKSAAPISGIATQTPDEPISVAASLTSAQALRVAQTLRFARRALNLDRLTSPIADNAFDHYRAVLDLDAQNWEAKTGLNVIAERYVELAQEYALKGNTTRAGVLLRRASAVVPFHPAVVNFWPNINRYGYALNDGQVNNEVPAKTVHSIQTAPPGVKTARVKAVAKAEIKQAPAQLTVNLVRSAESLDRQVAREARALVAQGKVASARLQLQAFVSDKPQALHSVRALFDLLLKSEAYADAKRLLAQNSDLPALELSKMTAYWFLAQDDLQGAGRAIDSQQANNPLDASFLALKAGVLQKLERYQESAQTYKTLLQQDQTNTAYWLGLAVASDAMNDAGAALQAFKTAEPGQKNAEVRRYIATRIRTLSKRSLSSSGINTNP